MVGRVPLADFSVAVTRARGQTERAIPKRTALSLRLRGRSAGPSTMLCARPYRSPTTSRPDPCAYPCAYRAHLSVAVCTCYRLPLFGLCLDAAYAPPLPRRTLHSQGGDHGFESRTGYQEPFGRAPLERRPSCVPGTARPRAHPFETARIPSRSGPGDRAVVRIRART